MPPKPSVNRDDILNAAITLIRQNGSDSINARSIAGVLNCSTKPLFRVYENMDQLKDDVYDRAMEFYYSFLQNRQTDTIDPFLAVGQNYIEFACQEKELFKYIFLSNHMSFQSLDEFANLPDIHGLTESIAMSTGLSEQAAKDLFLELWLLAHGIATMLATNPSTLDKPEVERLLIQSFKAQYQYLKSEEPSQ
jgi:hypothetical protein